MKSYALDFFIETFKMKHWYKIISVILILYTLVWGLLNSVPRLHILNETIRNVYYHVPIWFAMLFMMAVSLFYSIKALASSDQLQDLKAYDAALVGFFFSIPGLLTGSVWAKFTWGTWWTNDPKLNSAAIGMLMYFAYAILRDAIDDAEKKARISAVYNIFAFPVFVVLIFVLPRLTASLHPGNGGNPGFNQYDLDNNMRLIFYPAVMGWTLLGIWIASLRIRIKKVEKIITEN